MTPEAKARELTRKIYDTCNCTIGGTSTIFASIAKQCAIICVEEILAEVKSIDIDAYHHADPTCVQEWESVKQAIQKL